MSQIKGSSKRVCREPQRFGENAHLDISGSTSEEDVFGDNSFDDINFVPPEKRASTSKTIVSQKKKKSYNKIQ